MTNMKRYDLLYSKKNAKLISLIDHICSIFCNQKKINKKIVPSDNIKTIVIFANTRIGDAIMLLPLMHGVRKSYSNAHIIVFCDQLTKIIFERNNLADKYIDLDWKKLLATPRDLFKNYKIIKNKIKKIEHADILIETAGDFRIEFFMQFIKATRKVSTAIAGGECFLTDVVEIDIKEHPVEKARKIASYVGSVDNDNYVPILHKKKIFYDEYNIKKYDYRIGINIGASKNVKKWESFRELIQKIEIENTVFILYGIEEERKELEALKECSEMAGYSAIIIIEPLTKYIDYLCYSDVVICNDSSAGHLAAALGIPTISLFGPTDYKMWKPMGNNRVNVLSSELDCAPCNNMYCDIGKKCMNSITSEIVYKALLNEHEIFSREKNKKNEF